MSKLLQCVILVVLMFGCMALAEFIDHAGVKLVGTLGTGLVLAVLGLTAAI